MKKIVSGLLASIILLNLQAQETISNYGSLRIHNGAQITFHGNLQNKAGAGLLNDGNVYLKRNASNDQAGMLAGNGTLNMNGTIVQSINGSQPLSTYHLITNNATGIQLNNDLQLSGTHQFLNGMITTSSSYALVYKTGSSHSGSSDSRHVHGWVKKEGSTAFVFPVGSATLLRPVALSALSGVSVFSARHLLSTPYPTQLLSPLVTLHRNEYWEIQKLAGGTAKVDLNWDHSRIAFNNWTLPEITTAYFDGSLWTDIGGTASGSVTGTGNISSNAVASFNLFSFGSRSFPVPLTLLDFTARRKDGVSEIRWITTNEQDVDRFIVERSDDGRNFYVLCEKNARNSGLEETYHYNDTKPIEKRAWYRLKTRDIDGSGTVSRIIMVMDQVEAGKIAITNNPVQHHLQLSVKGITAGKYQYKILSANGTTVQKGGLYSEASQVHQLQLHGLSKGTYLLQINQDNQSYQARFIIQ